MKNLFICHTQAQLILASGLSLVRYKDDDNMLILFVDFGMKDELKARLDKIFSRTLYLQSIYPPEFNTVASKLKWYPRDWRLIKDFLSDSVDRVFVVCDWILLEQKTLQLVYKKNMNVEMNWLEDGITAYYKDSDIHKGLDKYKFTMLIRRLVIRDLLGVGKYYDRDFSETGGLRLLKKAFVCYPEEVREPYRSRKKLVGILDEEYCAGLQAMYPKVKIDITRNTVILVVDKLDRYLYPEKVQALLDAYIKKCRDEGKTVICKFHPRETETWEVFEGCPTMDKSVGIENAYVSLADQKASITITGIKSTGLMSAKKLGFSVLSLFPGSGESNYELEKFYSRIGISLGEDR